MQTFVFLLTTHFFVPSMTKLKSEFGMGHMIMYMKLTSILVIFKINPSSEKIFL